MIKKLINKIYSAVLEIKEEEKIEIKRSAEPKIITARGGIELAKDSSTIDEEKISEISEYWHGTHQNYEFDNITFDQLNKGEHKDLIDGVVKNVENFNEVFFKAIDEIKLVKEYDIPNEIVLEFKKEVTNRIKDELIRGIDLEKQKNSDISNVSLFFYPIKHALFEMSVVAAEFSSNQQI